MNVASGIFAIAVVGLFLFSGCQNHGETPVPAGDSTLVDTSLPCLTDRVSDGSAPDEVPEPPEPSLSRFGNDIHKVSRTLSDAEIASLSFDGYQFEASMSDFYTETLGSWKEYAYKYKPYYSVVRCPSCGHNLLVVFGSSPNAYWQSLSGQEGWFAICTHCRKVLDFEIVAMN